MALGRLFHRVVFQVLHEGMAAGVDLAALLALEATLPHVKLQVVREVRLAGKRLVAVRALKRELSRVKPFVLLPALQRAEFYPAVQAVVRLGRTFILFFCGGDLGSRFVGLFAAEPIARRFAVDFVRLDLIGRSRRARLRDVMG